MAYKLKAQHSASYLVFIAISLLGSSAFAQVRGELGYGNNGKDVLNNAQECALACGQDNNCKSWIFTPNPNGQKNGVCNFSTSIKPIRASGIFSGLPLKNANNATIAQVSNHEPNPPPMLSLAQNINPYQGNYAIKPLPNYGAGSNPYNYGNQYNYNNAAPKPTIPPQAPIVQQAPIVPQTNIAPAPQIPISEGVKSEYIQENNYNQDAAAPIVSNHIEAKNPPAVKQAPAKVINKKAKIAEPKEVEVAKPVITQPEAIKPVIVKTEEVKKEPAKIIAKEEPTKEVVKTEAPKTIAAPDDNLKAKSASEDNKSIFKLKNHKKKDEAKNDEVNVVKDTPPQAPQAVTVTNNPPVTNQVTNIEKAPMLKDPSLDKYRDKSGYVDSAQMLRARLKADGGGPRYSVEQDWNKYLQAEESGVSQNSQAIENSKPIKDSAEKKAEKKAEKLEEKEKSKDKSGEENKDINAKQ